MTRLHNIKFGLMVILVELTRSSTGFKCSTCARDGICDTIRGILSVTVMSQGYNPVVTIPRGACNINITEAGSSRNHLALKDSPDNYVFNGHWRLNEPGTYRAAGVWFRYVRDTPTCPGECIYSLGPTRSTVTVQVLYSDRSPGIFYTYQIPTYLRQRGETLSQAGPQYYTDTRRSELREPEVGYEYYTTTEEPVPSTTDSYKTPKGTFPEYSPFPSSSYIQRRAKIFPSDYSHLRGHTEAEGPADFLGPTDSLKDVTYSRGVYDNTVQVEEDSRDSDEVENIELSNVVDVYAGLGGEDDVGGSGDGIVSLLEEYSWKLTGYTNCSRLCGGGVQQTNYLCVRTDTGVKVETIYCENTIKPEKRHRPCNTEPCTPSWEIDFWSPCTVTCGQGYQTRNVTCVQRQVGRITTLEERYCTSQKPVVTKECYMKTCYRWATGDWSDCDAQCGTGTQHRQVECRDDHGSVVPDHNCEGNQPPEDRTCDMGACRREWYYSKWNDQCSSDCGTGVVTRSVVCATNAGAILPTSQCDRTEKPSAEKECKIGVTCGGHWFTGPWSQCSQSCGQGVRTRYVLCMKKIGAQLVMTSEHNCVADDKPGTSDTCSRAECGQMWFMTDWSECSKTCGGGVRRREVKCIGDEFGTLGVCQDQEMPEQTQTCNPGSCWTPPPQTLTAGCMDKYPNCAVVVQARLCRYHYYQRKCCASCSNNVHPSTRWGMRFG